ncbi:hypothetical protein NDU88_004969 [Pleurodeles waltl]|uniref:Uncharacterized protein n=1 Tax=Pleurodeles waltl TaxID=8319 RepID=A0AAV7L856_PLEWA|nr:hypothetical protein NDU88_004969 [Pleurodeles waltl]
MEARCSTATSCTVPTRAPITNSDHPLLVPEASTILLPGIVTLGSPPITCILEALLGDDELAFAYNMQRERCGFLALLITAVMTAYPIAESTLPFTRSFCE